VRKREADEVLRQAFIPELRIVSEESLGGAEPI